MECPYCGSTKAPEESSVFNGAKAEDLGLSKAVFNALNRLLICQDCGATLNPDSFINKTANKPG